MIPRFTTEEDGFNISRARSDRFKNGGRKMKNTERFTRKGSEQVIKMNQAPIIVESKENESGDKYPKFDEKINEGNKTVEINVTDDMMEIVISTQEVDDTTVKHEVTVHETEEDTPDTNPTPHSLILSALDLQEKMTKDCEGRRGTWSGRERHSTT